MSFQGWRGEWDCSGFKVPGLLVCWSAGGEIMTDRLVPQQRGTKCSSTMNTMKHNEHNGYYCRRHISAVLCASESLR